MRRQRILIALAILSLAAVVAGPFVIAPVYWDGAVPLPIRVTVANANDGTPVSGATVEFLMPGRSIGQWQTDANGTMTAVLAFPAGGACRLGCRSGSIYFGDHQLRLSAEGYETREFPLREKTGIRREIENREALSLAVKLSPCGADEPSTARAPRGDSSSRRRR